MRRKLYWWGKPPAMKIKFTLALALCCLPVILLSQTDSSWLDLGRIKLKKDFTQTITIKGKDLEHMPFANLDEAINVWLNGIATNSFTVTYVIDGNMMTHANAYTIHDIEEITLVQNAVVQLNGAVRESQLLLITTKRNRPGKSGISVAGSSFAVKNKGWNSYEPKLNSETNYYHRYDISAWRNSERVQYGVTAGWLQDVLPYASTIISDVKQNPRINRFRINGYLNARLNTNNSIWVRAGYVPGVYKTEYELSDIPRYSKIKEKESFIGLEAGWTSRISSHFTNEFSAGFTPAVNKDLSGYILPLSASSPNLFKEQQSDIKDNFNTLLFTDQFTWHAKTGNWLIEPSLNIFYRHRGIKSTNHSVERDLQNGDLLLSSNSVFTQHHSVFLLTPSVNLMYKDHFSIQGGLVYDLTGDGDGFTPGTKRALPYVTFGADVLKMAKVNSSVNWKLFGSYTTTSSFSEGPFALMDVDVNKISYPYPNRDYVYTRVDGTVSIGGGTTVAWMKGRMQASYNYERRRYSLQPYWGSNPGIPDYLRHNIHRLGISARIVETTAFTWQTGLNGTVIQSKAEFPNNYPYHKYKKPLYTGGVTNRIQFKKFMAGLDLLYVFNMGDYSGITTNDRQDALSIRNVYAGYQLQLKNKPLELYIATRNPVQPHNSVLPDKRTFWGAGFKVGL